MLDQPAGRIALGRPTRGGGGGGDLASCSRVFVALVRPCPVDCAV